MNEKKNEKKQKKERIFLKKEIEKGIKKKKVKSGGETSKKT